MTPIQATDEIIIPIPQHEVWSVIEDIAAYPNWWPRSVGLRVLIKEPHVIGSTLELRPLGGRSFSCCVESVEAPNKLCMSYFGGFISGKGEWRLESVGSNTRIQYELDVRAAGRVIAWVGRLLPLSRFHSFQMKQILRRLQKEVSRKMKSSAA